MEHACCGRKADDDGRARCAVMEPTRGSEVVIHVWGSTDPILTGPSASREWVPRRRSSITNLAVLSLLPYNIFIMYLDILRYLTKLRVAYKSFSLRPLFFSFHVILDDGSRLIS